MQQIFLRQPDLKILQLDPINLLAKNHGLIRKQHDHDHVLSDRRDSPSVGAPESHAQSLHDDEINYLKQNEVQLFQDQAEQFWLKFQSLDQVAHSAKDWGL